MAITPILKISTLSRYTSCPQANLVRKLARGTVDSYPVSHVSAIVPA